jgi:hypothetical protein
LDIAAARSSDIRIHSSLVVQGYRPTSVGGEIPGDIADGLVVGVAGTATVGSDVVTGRREAVVTACPST